jgi:hypothetical protein
MTDKARNRTPVVKDRFVVVIRGAVRRQGRFDMEQFVCFHHSVFWLIVQSAFAPRSQGGAEAARGQPQQLGNEGK